MIPFKRSLRLRWTREKPLLARGVEGKWTMAESVNITSPLNKQRMTSLPFGNAQDLIPTLSPDGKKLLVSYYDFSPEMPDEWRKSGFMQFRSSAGVIQAFHLLVLYDLATGETRVPLKTPWVIYAPRWSADGKSFVVVARPPINSDLERENVKNQNMGSSGAHLFWVAPDTGNVEDVASKLAYPWEGPLLWDKNGDLLVRVGSTDTITRFSSKGAEWQPVSSFRIPLKVGNQTATDGKYVIGEFNDTTTPPQLFIYRAGDKQI